MLNQILFEVVSYCDLKHLYNLKSGSNHLTKEHHYMALFSSLWFDWNAFDFNLFVTSSREIEI